MAPGFFPLDEELGLLPGSLTPWLHEALVRLGTWLPFERAPEELAFFTGVPVSVTTATRLTEAAGAVYVALQEAEVERLEREHPAAPAGPAVQQVSVDGAMVPLVGGEWAEVKTLAVGTVEQRTTGSGSTEVHTRELSYFSRLADAQTFTRQALGELHRRGTATAGTVAAPVDGSEWCQGFLDVHRPDAVRILDFPHALEHLSAAAQASFGPGTEATSTWLREQAHTLKHGDPAVVLAALRALPVAQAADPPAAAQVRDATASYLEKRWAQIQYASFQAQGYPIGSGCVESGNKVVVEARLKGPGMHWARHHVNPLVALRTIVCSDRWAEVWPQIEAGLRQQCWARQRVRRAASPPPVTAAATTPSPPAATVPAVTAPPPAPKAKTIVAGRPTSDHPWKRPLFTPRRSYAKS